MTGVKHIFNCFLIYFFANLRVFFELYSNRVNKNCLKNFIAKQSLGKTIVKQTVVNFIYK